MVNGNKSIVLKVTISKASVYNRLFYAGKQMKSEFTILS